MTAAKPSDPDDRPSSNDGVHRESSSRQKIASALNERIHRLLKPAKRGDDAAWTELVECLYPTVIAVVRNHLPYFEQEEDITQDIFVKVFMKLDHYKGTSPLTHWVSRIALHTCYDRLRAQKSRRVQSYSDLGMDDTEAIETLSTESIHSHGAVHESREATTELIDRLISTLTPDQQMVIRLIDLEEKSVAEACDLTGWGASKVKVTAMRARRKLTEALEKLESTPENTPDP